MIEYILGNYLVSKETISKEQLQETLENQSHVHVKMGLIAVAEGLMTTEQAEEVNKQQMLQDKRFGDIAIEKGYLTDSQVGNLLKMQGNTYLTFVQTLLDQELVKLEDVDKIMEEFRLENGFSPKDIERMKDDDVDTIISLYLPMDAMKYQEVIGVVIRTMLRVIDSSVCMEKALIANKAEVNGAVFQKIEGKTSMMTGLLEKGGGMLVLASEFSKEEFEELDEDVLDAAGEFLNCVNGIYAASESYKGVELELMPPEFHMDTVELEYDTICLVPICIKDKKVFFIIAQ